MRALLRSLGLLLGLASASCVLLLDVADAKQCTTDGDCKGPLAGRVCASGFCVVPTTPVGADGGDGCVSTELCTQANSNQVSVCKTRGTPCVPLENSQCFVPDADAFRKALMDPNAIVLGAIAPFTLKQADNARPKLAYTERMGRAMQLALEEIASAQPTGLLVGNTRRPLALLMCDSSGEADRAQLAFRHLTEVAGSEALLVLWDEDMAAVSALATEKRVAVACADCLAPLPAGPLAWRIIPTIAPEASMIARFIQDLEPTIRAANGDQPIRVALLAEQGRIPQAFVEAFLTTAIFNGEGPLHPTNQATFLSIRTEDPRTEAVQVAKWQEDLAKFEPDIVVSSMGPDLPRLYLPSLELAVADAGGRKPYYLVTNLSRDSTDFYYPLLAGNDDLRQRIRGSRPYLTEELAKNVTGYTFRYRTRFNFQQPDGNYGGYDGAFALGLAVIAAATQASVLDGPHISAGFESLVGGTPFDLGPAGLDNAIVSLVNQAKLDVRGLYSNLDWDVKTRELTSPVGAWCFQVDGNGGVYVNDQAGLRFDPQATNDAGGVGAFDGTFACP